MTSRTSKRKISLWSLVLGTLIATNLSAAEADKKEEAKEKNSNSFFSSLKSFTQKKADTVKGKVLAVKETALEKGLGATCGLCASPKIFVLSKSDTALNLALKNCVKNCVQRKYTLRLMSALPEGKQPAENEIYVEKQDSLKLKCKLLNLKGEVVVRTINHSVETELTETRLGSAEKAILTQLSKSGDIRTTKGVNTLLDDLTAQKDRKEDAPKEGAEKTEENQENQEEIKNLEGDIVDLEERIKHMKEIRERSNLPAVAREGNERNIIAAESQLEELKAQRDALKPAAKKDDLRASEKQEPKLKPISGNDEVNSQIDKIKKAANEVSISLAKERDRKSKELNNIKRTVDGIDAASGENICHNGKSNGKVMDNACKKVKALDLEVKSLTKKIEIIQSEIVGKIGS